MRTPLKYNLFVLLALFTFPCLSQTILYQDVFYGGVTAGGFSTGMGSGSGTVELYIEPGSTIRKAYLYSYTMKYPPPTPIQVNNFSYLFDTTNCIMNVTHTNPTATPVRLYFYDITSDLNNDLVSNFDVTIPGADPTLPTSTGWFTVIIYIEYENPTLSRVAASIWLNDKNYIGSESYEMSGMNPIDTEYPVGLSLFIDRACDITEDGTVVTLNNNIPLGTIGLPDAVNGMQICSGSKGHFYYQNYELHGLDDDTPDNLMGGADALADISSYLANEATSYSMSLVHQQYPMVSIGAPNLGLLFINSYTSPCDTFIATISDDISICKGEQIQLHATGGVPTSSTTGYQWQPQIDLSCYDCPNPIFSGDTSRFYTCRIWNTDSCSKVLPVKVNVLTKPDIPDFITTPTECYGHTGTIAVGTSSSELSYSLDKGSTQSSNVFNQLVGGYHLLTVTDGNGCTSDTSIYIDEVNSTVAQFTLTPESGYLPLEVTLNNQSEHATDYIWYIGNDTLHKASAEPFTYTFQQAGSFDIALVSYHTFEHCVDTAYKSITVEYPFTVIIPTLYGGYAEGSPYRIYTSGLSSLQFKLYSNDGRLIRETELSPTAGYIQLWESTDIAAGLYLYRAHAIAEDGSEKLMTGKIVVM